MRKLSVDDDLEHPVYWVRMLALDDLDRVEAQYRALVRDVIVHREQNSLTTLITLTDAKVIREYGDQVYRRITAATQLPLGKRSIPAELGMDIAVNKWLFNSDTVDKALEYLMRENRTFRGSRMVVALGKAIAAVKPCVQTAHDTSRQRAEEKKADAPRRTPQI
jgi:hypothetical protein